MVPILSFVSLFSGGILADQIDVMERSPPGGAPHISSDAEFFSCFGEILLNTDSVLFFVDRMLPETFRTLTVR